MQFLRKHAEGATEGRADYWYGVIESIGGTMVDTLFYSEHDARKAADEFGGGQVVIFACRPLEDAEGEHWPLPVRTKEMELAESAQAVADSRKTLEDAIARSKAKN